MRPSIFFKRVKHASNSIKFLHFSFLGEEFKSTIKVEPNVVEISEEESEAESSAESTSSSSDRAALTDLLTTLKKRGTISYVWLPEEKLYRVILKAGLNTKVEKIDSKLTLTRFLRENGVRMFFLGKKCAQNLKSP